MGKEIAIVMGASSGMGRECVLQIAAKYPGLEELWVIARRKDRLEALVPMVGTMEVRPIVMDVTKKKELERLEKLLAEETPRVRIAALAAGCGYNGAFRDLQTDEVRNMVRLNDESLAVSMHLFLPYLNEGSKVLLFASSAAFAPQVNFGVYAASKSFVLSLARTLHYELRRDKICVTAVCPGPVETEFLAIASHGEAYDPLKAKFLVQPKDVVAKALKDMERGRELSVYSTSMKLVRFATKIVPHAWILWWESRGK
ncbi:MAG: SDR family NAD(P)-dependent oxidoreductase [Lachnospiraceae bacterium]|nr:SDR family NAD(P)-dependent oxidoreductase [Lachnospiraceae bacterium]